MATCIIRRSGRLGNQLFEYAALRSWLADGDRLVLLGFEELLRACDGIEADVVGWTRTRSRLYTAAHWFAHRAPGRAVNCVGQDLPATGPLRGLSICEESYYQDPGYVDPTSLAALRPRVEHLTEAASRLRSALRPGENPVFTHVRRTDFLTWGVDGRPAALSGDWIRDRTRDVVEAVPNARVVVLSDDLPHALAALNEFDPVSGSADAAVDLAIMATCSAGVLSPSSFAWWGAWFAVNRGTATGPFVAPQYWAGHAAGRWYPPKIETDFLDYVPT